MRRDTHWQYSSHRRHIALVFLFLIVAAAMTACQRKAQTEVARPTKPCPFNYSYASLDDLGRATVKALNESDTLGLWNLSVTEQEFRDIIWARTPNVGGMEWSYAWQVNLMDAYKAIDRKLEDLGSKKLRYAGVELADTTVVVYPEKKTYHNVLTVAETPEGEIIKFRFLNVVQEVDGWYKVVAFHE